MVTGNTILCACLFVWIWCVGGVFMLFKAHTPVESFNDEASFQQGFLRTHNKVTSEMVLSGYLFCCTLRLCKHNGGPGSEIKVPDQSNTTVVVVIVLLGYSVKLRKIVVNFRKHLNCICLSDDVQLVSDGWYLRF